MPVLYAKGVPPAGRAERLESAREDATRPSMLPATSGATYGLQSR